MTEKTKKLIWDFGRVLWENEYAEDPGEFENPNRTNMIGIFDAHIKSLINKPVETTNEQPLGLHLAISKILIKAVEDDVFEAQFPKHINKACIGVTDKIIAKLKEYGLIV